MHLVAEVWREQPVTPVWVVAVSGVTALFIVLTSDAWRLARNVITIAHEGGHALASVLSGRFGWKASGCTPIPRGRPTRAAAAPARPR